jgi:hypothetical protein
MQGGLPLSREGLPFLCHLEKPVALFSEAHLLG